MPSAPVFTQESRGLQISTPLPADAVLIERLTGHEDISELYEFELDLLLQPSLLPDSYDRGGDKKYLAFERLLGQEATVTLRVAGCPERSVHGLIARLAEGRTESGNGGRELVRCTAVLVPRLWLLTRRTFSRVFQGQTVPDVLKFYFETLWRLPYSFPRDPQRTYEKRPLCVQYQETDFDFVSRLMEEEGIRYHFTHASGGHQLVLRDDPLGHPVLPAPNPLPYAFYSAAPPNGAVITDWQTRGAVEPAEVKVRDFTLMLAGRSLMTPVKQAPDQVAVGQVTQKVKPAALRGVPDFGVAAGFAGRFDEVDRSGSAVPSWSDGVDGAADRAAVIRMQQAAGRSLTIEGSGTAAHMLPGHRFDLQGKEPATGQYLITRVEHTADQRGVYTPAGDGATVPYRNHFFGQPAALPYRPARTRAPQPVTHPTTATVVADPASVAPGGVACDKYGRVKVAFHWDAKDKWAGAESRCTCWLSVAQAWAGLQRGSFYIPRVGDEVIVSFLDGRPDRPVVTGSVHSMVTPPPFWDGGQDTVPNTVSGLRTATVGGGTDDYSMISVDDRKDNELVAIRANRDTSVYTKHDATANTDNDVTVQTGNDLTVKTGHNLTLRTGNNATNLVAVSQEEIVGYDGWMLGLKGLFTAGNFADVVPVPGNASYTYGGRLTSTIPMRTDITLGSLGSVFIDPLDYAFNKMMDASDLKTVLTAVGGKTDILYGNETRIMYGSLAKNFCLGQTMTSVLEWKASLTRLKVFSALHLACSAAAIFLPLAKAKASGTAAKVLGVVMTLNSLALTGVQVALKVYEKKQRITAVRTEIDQVRDFLNEKKDVAQETAGTVLKDRQDLSTYADALQAGKPGIHHHEVENQYGVQCGRYFLMSEGDVSVSSRSAVNQVAAETYSVAEKHTVAGENVITLVCGKSVVTMEKEQITLAVDRNCKIQIGKNKVALVCGSTSLEVTAAKITKLSQLIKQQSVSIQAQS